MDAGGVATVTEESLGQILAVLDKKSRALLWYLWCHRHAEISELRKVAGARSDFEVLHRLKEVINGKAQELFGKPIVAFEHSRVDPVSGEKVLFSWWFLEDPKVSVSGVDGPLVDIFDEGETVTLIAQMLVPVNPDRPNIQLKNGILKVEFAKDRKAALQGELGWTEPSNTVREIG